MHGLIIKITIAIELLDLPGMLVTSGAAGRVFRQVGHINNGQLVRDIAHGPLWHVKRVGKKSPAHDLAIKVFKVKASPDREVSAQEVLAEFR